MKNNKILGCRGERGSFAEPGLQAGEKVHSQDIHRAVVVGGSNGIGLAVAKEFINMGFHADILDMVEPERGELEEGAYTYHACNLLDFDEPLFGSLSQDAAVSALVITAGFGRVANFESLHPAEIQNLMQVNATSGIRIIRCFYPRISSKSAFYCGMMGSIAGLVSSPLFSVYAASKAAVCRFIESVNIELEVKGTANRILNVSPASIAGTRFNGGPNEPAKVEDLARRIVEKMLAREQLFIPQYEETYKAVLEHYKENPHGYGLRSYEYKMSSGRMDNGKRAVVGYLSGTFDLFHIGHLNLLKRAKRECDYLIVGVHPDASHKGKETFIPFEERKSILGGIRYVDKVVRACPEDDDAWILWHYDRLFVGSDYVGTARFQRYEKFFSDKDVKIVYFPYTQGTSSTQVRQAITDRNLAADFGENGGVQD